jgi:hypothetical protein
MRGALRYPSMSSIQETLASWATILGAVLSVISALQSSVALTGTGILLVGASIAFGVYARRERLAIDSASVTIEGKSIDALNMANLRRRANKSLVIQEVHHEARIDGEDLSIAWRYSGYCRADRESVIEFSVDAESAVPFDQLDCSAYDLVRDPCKSHPIRPLLIGPDGISKKIAVPFIEPLTASQPFSVSLECHLPGCMKADIGYYTSTLSFGQDHLRRYSARLIFAGTLPNWLRVYQCPDFGPPKLLKNLVPSLQESEFAEYVDIAEDIEAQLARVYLFRRFSPHGAQKKMVT